MKRDYDVIIIGSGPAGATLAFELASYGIGVLILEKAGLPRYKCCAGGLTAKAAKLLDVNLDEIAEDAIISTIVTFAGDKSYKVSSNKPIMYTVMRDSFDLALVNRAEKAGADVLQGVEAIEINFDETSVETLTTDGAFYSRFIVGADGARSIVAKSLGINIEANSMVAIESEVLVADGELARWKSQILIDVGCISGGYGWVFPKADHLSVGLVCLTNKEKQLKRRYSEFMDSLNLGPYQVARLEGSILPICIGERIVVRGRGVLIGDAAGLADPLTGEGIYNAILSAKLVAPIIEKSLQYNKNMLYDYQKLVDERIIPEMKIAHIFSQLLSLMPKRFFQLLKSDDRIWRACCDMLSGEMSYTQIKNRINVLGGLYDLVSRNRK